MTFLKFPHVNLDNVEGVLVDIDDTLYPYEPAHQAAITACYEQYLAKTGDDIEASDFNIWYRANRSAVTKALSPQGACRSRFFAFQAMLEDKKIPHSYTLAAQLENAYWETFIERMLICDDAKIFLERCRKNDIKVCAVSDMQAQIQIRKLVALGLYPLIDFLVTSEEVGVEKPCKLIFERALQKIMCDPSRTIMIGNSQTKDVDGAKNIGMTAFKVEVIFA